MKRKAQSVTEYAILLGIVIAVFAGMQTYVKRGMQARVKKGTDVVTGAGADMQISIGEANYNVSFGNLSQYEPYYSYSKSDSYSESVTQEHTGDGKVAKEIVSELNVQAAGGESGQLIGSGNSQSSWDNVK